MVRRIASLLAALGVLIAMTAPAAADPITLIGTVVSGLLTAGGSASIAATFGLSATSFITLTAASNFIAAALLTGAALLFGATGAGKIDPGKAKETITAAEESERRALGRVRLGGVIAFGSTNATRRFRMILQARKLDAFEEFYLGGFEVVRNDAGEILSKPYVISGTKYITLKTDTGDESKTAWSDLTTYFPAIWTSNHRARGIAQVLALFVSPGLTSSRFLRLYQQGVPGVETVARGEPVFDPRQYLASPATQDPNDPDTFTWSDNGVLGVLHIAKQFQEFGYAAFDLAQIAEAADEADVIVNTLTGTEPRSRCWGVWPSEGPRGDTLSQVLQSTGCEMFTTDSGLIGIRLIEDDRAAEVEFAWRHIVTINWRSGPESVERHNRLRLRYYSPERRYEMAEIEVSAKDWAIYQDEIDKVGEQVLDIDLPFCPSASQAQRIGRRLFATARAARGQAVLNMAGMAAWGCKVVDLQNQDLSVTWRAIISPPRCRDSEGVVEIPFIVQPDLDTWDASTMEAAAPSEVPEVVYAGASDTPSAPAVATVVQKLDASYETRVSISIGNTGGFRSGAVNSEVSYRTVNPLPSEWRQLTPVTLGTAEFAYVTGLDLRTIPCEFRVRSWNNDDENTKWSPLLSATPAIVNTATGVPVFSFDVGTGLLSVRAPNDMRVSYVRVQPPLPAGATNYTLQPGESRSLGVPAVGTWQATAHTSNGTASSTASTVI